MDDCHAQATAGFENARYFAHGGRHRIDVVKRHEGDRQVCAGGGKRQRGSVGQSKIHQWIRLARRSNQGGRGIDTNDVVAERLQVSREPAFAATDVNCPPPRRRHDLEELIAVEAPVAIVPGRSTARHGLPNVARGPWLIPVRAFFCGRPALAGLASAAGETLLYRARSSNVEADGSGTGSARLWDKLWR